MLASSEIRRQLIVYEQKLNIKEYETNDQIKYSIILHVLEQVMPIKPTIHINQLYGDCGSDCQDEIIYSCSEYSTYIEYLNEVIKEKTTTHVIPQTKPVTHVSIPINHKENLETAIKAEVGILLISIYFLLVSCGEKHEVCILVSFICVILSSISICITNMIGKHMGIILIK